MSHSRGKFAPCLTSTNSDLFLFFPFTVSPALLAFHLAFCAKPLCSAASLSLTQRTSSPQSLPHLVCSDRVPVRGSFQLELHDPAWGQLGHALEARILKHHQKPPPAGTAEVPPLPSPGRMGGWSLLSEVAPHFKLFSRFSRPYRSRAASDDWKRFGLFKGMKGKGVGDGVQGARARWECEDVEAKDRQESCRALGCADLSCTYSKYFWAN